MKEFYIVDSTLRDGEQASGVGFSKEQKVLIAKMLDEAGVDIIEGGIPASGIEEMDNIYAILNSGIKATVMSWNRMRKEDIDKSIFCGVKHVHISAPVSDVHIFKKLRKDKLWVLSMIEELVAYAIGKGCKVSVGAEDASRADFDYLIRFYEVAVAAGATRVRYADTVGALDPLGVFNTIQLLRKCIEVDIDFHGHNDFGMATANALSAFKAGAKYISCCVNGLGERAGNTALEEIVMALKYLCKCESHIDVTKFMELSELVEKASGRYVTESKPIVGKKVFSHESGIHVDGLLKDTTTYEFFPPEDIGRKRDFVLGKSSGIKGIVNKFSELGVAVNKKEAEQLLSIIKKAY